MWLPPEAEGKRESKRERDERGKCYSVAIGCFIAGVITRVVFKELWNFRNAGTGALGRTIYPVYGTSDTT